MIIKLAGTLIGGYLLAQYVFAQTTTVSLLTSFGISTDIATTLIWVAAFLIVERALSLILH